MSQPIRGWGGHLAFPIGPKNTNLVEDVEILHPVKFRWIPFSGFREEVENVKVYGRTTDGRRADGRTDDGRCAMTIVHLSLRLRWAKKQSRLKFFKRRSLKGQSHKFKSCRTMLKVLSKGILMCNMKAASLLLLKLWPRLKFVKSRSNFKVKFTRSKLMVPSERFFGLVWLVLNAVLATLAISRRPILVAFYDTHGDTEDTFST